MQRIEEAAVANLRVVDLEALCTLYGFDAHRTAAFTAAACRDGFDC
ncbi:hypothetical protein [Nocardia sp. NPDC005745]